jgi:glycosyltransferase involved in cell wall biosynthesis
VIHLFADILGRSGGIETYLHALATHLLEENVPFRIVVSENAPCPLLVELEAQGVEVDRQPVVPGDRWLIRKRLLVWRLARKLKADDWVFCVRQPLPGIYLQLVRAVHRRKAKIAASWMFAPRFLPPPAGALGRKFNTAVAETDRVISVAHCNVPEFREVYGYEGPVSVVRYHNLPILDAALPLPPGPPWRIGFLGRVDIAQKNLDVILEAFELVTKRRSDLLLDIHGDGSDLDRLQAMIDEKKLSGFVTLHGGYDHRRDLAEIVAARHVFLYTSRWEGGPCFSLMELLQAGRFVITSPVGGIPDIYAGREEAGVMVADQDVTAIADAIDAAISALQDGGIDGGKIRERYEEEFTMAHAHTAWAEALRR